MPAAWNTACLCSEERVLKSKLRGILHQVQEVTLPFGEMWDDSSVSVHPLEYILIEKREIFLYTLLEKAPRTSLLVKAGLAL